MAVVGGGNSAAADALLLSRICEKVTVIHRRDEFRGEQWLVNALVKKENVDFVKLHLKFHELIAKIEEFKEEGCTLFK